MVECFAQSADMQKVAMPAIAIGQIPNCFKGELSA